MKKKLLALLLCFAMIASIMLPMTALAVSGTWDVTLDITENTAVTCNEQNTLEVGFAVQSDDLTLCHAQSVLFVFDFEVLQLVSKSGKPITSSEYMDTGYKYFLR